MMDDDNYKAIGDAAAIALGDIADEITGDLNSFKRLREFFDNETSHLPSFVIDRIKAAVEDFKAVFESHIEVIALAKMMATNVAADGAIPSYPVIGKAMGRQDTVLIKPQVKIGPYRADFIVENLRGHSFLVECDGKEFHDRAADSRRDAEIERSLGLRTFRLTGREIWRDDTWRPTFSRWCRGKMFDRNRPTWEQEFEALLRERPNDGQD